MAHHDTLADWIERIKARGLGNWLALALDVLEPLGPLGAQVVWVAQPVLGLWLPRSALGGLAEALEAPGGVEGLRVLLEANDTDNDTH